ncbi:MAG TPA: TetR/AcrR family transcriptional regulator [Sporichthyaceae bacterium]|nr:TetR/AcrR family transcriptional regulator [Sporichthyaceae bacterium]
MPARPAPAPQSAPTRDRDAYFAAAYELLLARGCEAVTVAALCARLGVTKGSFYHHFADMPDFVAAFAERWQEWMTTRVQGYATIADPLLRMEHLQNDLPEILVGADQAIRVWGRTDPVFAVALENVQRLVEEIAFPAIGQILGDRELGVLWGRMSYCVFVGLQLRMEPIDPERFLMAACEANRRIGIGCELVRVDGRLRTKLTHGAAAELAAHPEWRKPDLSCLLTVQPTRPSGDPTPPQRPGPRDREAYFTAAWELLVQRGFDAVTLVAMCDRLSVTKGSFQHHFGSMPQFIAALAEHWERNSNVRLGGYRAQADPMVRLSRMHQQFLGGPDSAGSAWRAWGHVESVVGQALIRVDRNHLDLLSNTLAEVSGDPDLAELLAEITLALLIGLKQPRPDVGPGEAAWMALEWARRILRVHAELHLDRGRVVLVVRDNYRL